ncbi:MAG: hypothetical protein P4K93_06770 [Terracidiphilus sp.]|nr:hypothetical protein [Terracidiphilus sp.]
MAARDTNPSLFPAPEQIWAELDRILKSPAFRKSKRYPRFLTFIVEQVLIGKADQLKERLLGIEVFDRPPDYELATDPIVRVAAGEIRKRLAQYYSESGYGNGIRIRLQPGSYVPEFQFSETSIAPELNSSPTQPSAVPLRDILPNRTSGLRHKRTVATIVAALGLTMIPCLYLLYPPNPVDEFWKPFLKSADSPLICLGDSGQGDKEEGPGIRTGVNSYDHLALGDVDASNRISTFLARNGRPPSISNSRATSFADLRKQPAVLIGGTPNPWTMRYMPLLRFQIVRDFRPGVNGILDKDDVSQLRWAVDFNAPYSAIPAEYAIVARFHNPATGMPTVIAAGVGAKGEIAAAEFLTTPAYLSEFTSHAPRGWKDRNIEIILETQMINGDSGPPHVVATYLW